jgi:flagellar export protein FliJ
MKPFLFRLERLFDLRRKEERARAGALGRARQDELARRETLDEANGHLDRCSRQAADHGGEATPAGVLRNLDLAVRAAAGQVEAAADSHQAAAEVVQVEREKLESAQQKRRVVERLRERKQEAHSLESSRQEQRELDGSARRHREWRRRQ